MSKAIIISDELHKNLMAMRKKIKGRYTNTVKYESVENVIRRLMAGEIQPGKD